MNGGSSINQLFLIWVFLYIVGGLLNAYAASPIKDPEAIYRMADSLLSAAQYNEAEKHFKIAQDAFLEYNNYRYSVSCKIKLSRIAAINKQMHEAGSLLEQAENTLRIYQVDQFDSLYSNLFYRKAYYSRQLGDNENALFYYHEAARIREQRAQNDYRLSLIYNNLGAIYNELGDPTMAASLFEKTVRIREALRDVTDVSLSKPLSNLGAIQVMLGHYEEADNNLKRARYILVQQYGDNHPEIGNVDNNLGNLAISIGDYRLAESYYNNALRIFNMSPSALPDVLSHALNNLGLVYTIQERYPDALELYLRNLEFQERYALNRSSQTFSKMANVYNKIGDYELAETYYQLAIKNLTETYGPDFFELATHYLNLGVFYSERGRYDASSHLYNKALALYTDTYGYRHPETSRVYFNLAWLKKETGEYDSSLVYVQHSLISNTSDFNALDITRNPRPDQCFSKLRLLSSLKLKSDLLTLKFHASQSDRMLASTAFRTIENAIQVIERMRFEYNTEESQLYLAQNEKGTYTQAIQLAILLYELTEDTIYKSKIFNYTEKSKAAILLAGIRGSEAIRFGGIPESLLMFENELRGELSYYTQHLFDEKRLRFPDSNKINLFKNYIFELSQQYDSLISSFEKNYPAYYNLKYDPSVLSYQKVQKQLDPNDVLMEYAILDSTLLILALGHDFFHSLQVPTDSHLIEQITYFHQLVSEKRFSEHVREDYERFVEILRTLYLLLMAPYQAEIHKKDLIIIPDENLASIPFDLLLIESPDQEPIRYDQLPYLIRNHNISYSYSATLHFNTPKRNQVVGRKLLAVAPLYDAGSRNLPDGDPRKLLWNNLAPLPFAKDEVEGIRHTVRGHILTGSEATESRFKSEAPRYHILHLAMHTIIDESDPMFSKLAFSLERSDSLDDGFLNVQEIYNMDLNARLTVLSSCSSGAGRIQVGEGIMSIARSFLYAGSPSIIMTLWEVDDRSGSDIMNRFYSYLKKGFTVDRALRQAKLDYLDNAGLLRSHPYFWSAYISIGDRSAVYRHVTFQWALVIGLGTVVVLVMFLFLKRKLFKV